MSAGSDGSVSGGRATSARGVNGGSHDGDTQYATGQGATHSSGATSAAGATYNGQTQAQQGEGVTHSGTCTDAAGNTVACR